MSVRAFGWLTVLGLALAVGCGGGSVAVLSPQTVGAVPGNPVQTVQAILAALPRRGWAAESVQPGRIVARLLAGQRRLRVDIRHDAQQVAIYYVDSDHLAARIEPTGHIYAHPKVNAWIRNLSMDIAASVATTAQSAGAIGQPVPPPAPAYVPNATAR